MGLVVDIAGWACLLGGSALVLIGALGILRLPDVFARMHGAGIIDTLGMGLLMIGMMIQAGITMVTVKLILIVAFLLFTGPTATHALARAALHGGETPKVAEQGETAPSKT